MSRTEDAVRLNRVIVDLDRATALGLGDRLASSPPSKIYFKSAGSEPLPDSVASDPRAYACIVWEDAAGRETAQALRAD